MRKREIDFLHSHVAPVMRAQAQIDPAAVIFELDVTRLSVTRMNRDDKRFIVLKERCIDAIKELPMTLKMVNKHEELIREALQPTFWHEASEEHKTLQVHVRTERLRTVRADRNGRAL